MSMVGFPLLLIPLAIYNIIVFLMPGVSIVEPIFQLTLMSGAEWPVSLSDMLLGTGLLLLLFEIIKGAKPGAKFLTDHLLSLIVFGAAAAEFLLWPRFATSTYFLLALLALVDFLSGVALRTKRRVQPASGDLVSRRGTKKSEPVPKSKVEEPRVDPVVAMPMPAAASVAESVLSERPVLQVVPPSGAQQSLKQPLQAHLQENLNAPSNALPIVTVSPTSLERSPAAHEPSPEITSPGLQPPENVPPSPDKPAAL
jgi:hypothetical protein